MNVFALVAGLIFNLSFLMVTFMYMAGKLSRNWLLRGDPDDVPGLLASVLHANIT